MGLFLGLARWEGGRGNPETPVPGCLAGSEDAGGRGVVTRLHHHLPTCPIHTALPCALIHMRLHRDLVAGRCVLPGPQRLRLDVLADRPSSPGIRCGISLGPHVLWRRSPHSPQVTLVSTPCLGFNGTGPSLPALLAPRSPPGPLPCITVGPKGGLRKGHASWPEQPCAEPMPWVGLNAGGPPL